MLANDQPGIEVELHNQIVKASCQLLKSAGEVLRLSPMPGRRHYIFNLKDLASCFQVIIARKVSFFPFKASSKPSTSVPAWPGVPFTMM